METSVVKHLNNQPEIGSHQLHPAEAPSMRSQFGCALGGRVFVALEPSVADSCGYHRLRSMDHSGVSCTGQESVTKFITSMNKYSM